MHFNINHNQVGITCNCLGKADLAMFYRRSLKHHLILIGLIYYSSGNNAFGSLHKSPLHHSSVNAVSKNLLSGTSQLGGSNKTNISNAATNVGSVGVSPSLSPFPKELMSFHDQLKKSRPPPPPAKPNDGFSSNTTNSLMNQNQMRNIQSSAIGPNQQSTQAAPMRQRPTSGNSPQVLLSSDDEIMDDSLVGK